MSYDDGGGYFKTTRYSFFERSKFHVEVDLPAGCPSCGKTIAKVDDLYVRAMGVEPYLVHRACEGEFHPSKLGERKQTTLFVEEEKK